MRTHITKIVESHWFQYGIIAAILLNAITLGLETVPSVMNVWGPLILAIDAGFITLFTIEIALKLFAYRGLFFKNGWNNFDFIIVVISLVPFAGNLSVLRALRILRVLRLISVVPQFRRVVQGFFDVLSGLFAVGGVLAIIFYVAAVISTKLFGTSFPEFFGSIPASLYSLFQIMTLESWSMGIVRPVMEIYPYAWLVFIPFILVTTFAVVNLLIGIIVTSMQTLHEEEEERLTKRIDAQSMQHATTQEKLDTVEALLKDIRKNMS